MNEKSDRMTGENYSRGCLKYLKSIFSNLKRQAILSRKGNAETDRKTLGNSSCFLNTLRSGCQTKLTIILQEMSYECH